MGLRLSIGQCGDQGPEALNQDFHGAVLPAEPMLGRKGAAIALADGISSSAVSQVASESAVKAFLSDYYCTADTWSVRTSAQRVIAATNSWLHALTRQSPYRHDRDRGYVCTFSALVLKSATAYLFHVGDTRICRVQGRSLEQLTTDHRIAIGGGQHPLSRALGMDRHVEIDHLAIAVEPGDLFVLTTDGVHGFLDAHAVVDALHADASLADLDAAARRIVAAALARGSDDNLTVQLVRIDAVPQSGTADEVRSQLDSLPLPPPLTPRMRFDGYRIVRELATSHRSHVHLAIDEASGTPVVLKTPSVDQQADPAYLERLLMEEWIARRIDSPHVLRAHAGERPRQHLYIATEYIDGQTLAQWMTDHPRPDLESVRTLAEQIARGLLAFHRREMVHQDLRPQNVLIDACGTVKIIDFGSTLVAGVQERSPLPHDSMPPGTLQYTAPECLRGEMATPSADLFALAVLVYQLLSGRLPYGVGLARATSTAAQRRLRYQTVRAEDRDLPIWLDAVLRKALSLQPHRRQHDVLEFVHDLRQPGPEFTQRTSLPLVERHPVLFWKSVAAALGLLVLVLLKLLLASS
jgi:serine/threonine protein phosphatase PrpC